MESIVKEPHAKDSQDVKPFRWTLSVWARQYRRLARPWVVMRHVRRFCQPFTVQGREHLEGIRGHQLLFRLGRVRWRPLGVRRGPQRPNPLFGTASQ